MYKYILPAFIILPFMTGCATPQGTQTRYGTGDKHAITESGQAVILYESGKWAYLDQTAQKSSSISNNNEKFYKSNNATFQLKSNKNDIAVWLDPGKWSFSKSKTNTEAEYQFVLKGKDLHGLMINEAIEIKVETLVNIALENAKRAAPDARIVSAEYRTVNGLRVVQLHIIGTIQGIRFAYLGYYYSNKSGTTQLLTFTSTNLFNRYKAEAEEFLNGMVSR
ncbi:MAG: hypothetical protein OEZ39_06915 [Gammaproteobacteria bacterium]|nr:hypothetical protein [Gammaproteobacteria bacterium]MDH5651587.1 hypothetical protein [Gammaproteobacteria bacterium]